MSEGELARLAELVAPLVAAELRIAPVRTSEFVTVTEAAELARVTESTVRRWIRTGALTGGGSPGRVLIDRAELSGLLAGGRVSTRPRRRYR